MEEDKKVVRLYRKIETRFGYFGKIHIMDKSFYSLEPRWLSNEKNVSCIPADTYDIRYSFHHAGGYYAYEIMNVPDRDFIKIHVGNTIYDTQGCILIGNDIGSLNGNWAITNSRMAFNEFMRLMDKKDGKIYIMNSEEGLL